MASLLGSALMQQQSLRCAPSVGANRSLLKPQPLVPRSRALRASNITATAKAPVQPVKITIQGRRLPVTDAIKQYVEEKITKAVHNYTNNIKKIDVTISARGGDTGTHGARQQKVDVTITTMRSGVVRVEDAEESLYASIDLVADKITRKLKKVKDKMIAQGQWPGRAGPRLNTDEEEFKEYMDNLIVETMSLNEQEARAAEVQLLDSMSDEGMPDSIVRSKVVEVLPMTPAEAIDALEALGHDFFVFRDRNSNTIQVLYKRESSGFGILIPQ